MGEWVPAITGLVGVLVGTFVGAGTTLRIQRMREAEERRRRSSNIVGHLKVLLDIYSPGRWMVPPESLEEATRDLNSHEQTWRDMSPELLSLPVFYPDSQQRVEDIYTGMSGLTRGTWVLARHSAKGFDAANKVLKDLEERQAALRKLVDELMREMWK